MKRTIILMASFACFLTMKRGDTHPATTQQVTAAQGTGPVIRFVAGSTVKLQQLLGEQDKEKHQPTLSLTETRYGIRGTDLGNSFDHGFSRRHFSPCAFFPLPFRANFTVAGAKALTILVGSGTTKVVP